MLIGLGKKVLVGDAIIGEVAAIREAVYYAAEKWWEAVLIE